jgi:flavodoxin
MKRLVILLLAGGLILSLTACGGAQSAENAAGPTAPEQETVSAPAEQTEQAESASAEASPAEDGGKTDTLILYFSAANTNRTDAVSSATPIIKENSSTGLVAEYIHDAVGGDVAEIVPVEPYPEGFDELADWAKEEADRDARPAFEPLEVDPTAYQTVFVGYPVWWYTIPMVMESFFDTYDFSGVTIVPFNTHEGSGDSGTYETIREREPDATVLEGLAVRGGDAGKEETRTAVDEWLRELQLE